MQGSNLRRQGVRILRSPTELIMHEITVSYGINLSRKIKWWERQNSNLRYSGCRPDVLAAKLLSHKIGKDTRTRTLIFGAVFQYSIPLNYILIKIGEGRWCRSDLLLSQSQLF